jgi:hypothetical protein
MKNMSLPLATALLGMGVLLLCQPAGQAADDQTANNNAVQVQKEGPIHEAFAASRSQSLQPPQQVNKQPPPDLNEEMPNEKPDEDNAQWIPGYWEANGPNDFVWVSGCWRVPPPGRQWVCGYWQSANGKWRRQRGFWTACNAGADDQSAEQDLSYYPQPPAPREEDPGEDPDGESDYVPGSWTYAPGDGGGFSFSSGTWVRRRPGWLWIAPSWTWTPAGYLWNRGYWDYSYVRRGWAYAPVVVPWGIWNRPGWVFRPRLAISPGSLNRNSLALVGNRYRLNGAVITPVNRLTGVNRVPVSGDARRYLLNQAKKLKGTGIQRRQLEGKGKHPGKGVVRHKLKVPRPRATKNPQRLNPPPRPARSFAKKPSGTGGVRRPGAGAVRRPPARPPVKKPGSTAGVKKPARHLPAREPAVRKPGGPPRKPAGAHKPARKPSGAHKPAKRAGGAHKPAARKPAAKKAGGKKTAAHKSPPRRAGSARRSGGGGRRR